MITLWQQQDGRLVSCEHDALQAGISTWVDARCVTREDIRILEEEYHIRQEHILDMLDPDELSRIEQDDEYILTIVRLPVFSPSDDINYFTVPFGMVLFPDRIVTICWTDCEVIEDIPANKIRGLTLSDFPAFIVKIMSRADTVFLRYLKEINRRSTSIQNELQLSVKNNELLQLLNLEKSLVFFTTSLKSNQLLFEKLTKTKLITFDSEDQDWLEDVEIDNRQAIEMAETYSNILSGMMDTFASVISNNLNLVMKRLTVISLILMIPTLIVSFFGMNVPLPFMSSGWLGIGVISAACVLAAVFASLLLKERSSVQRRTTAVQRERVHKHRRERRLYRLLHGQKLSAEGSA